MPCWQLASIRAATGLRSKPDPHEMLGHMTPLGLPVPADDADGSEFCWFARTPIACCAFSDYRGDLYTIPPGVIARWERSSELPNDLLQLRSYVFSEQRACYYAGGYGLPFKDKPLVRALVDKIREISGGVIRCPAAESEGGCECVNYVRSQR
ncbi:hypothetical protein GCM10011591_29950 [Nocardia camponoti]|uniref:Uncharacterized protein n=1 Tax=Nocardia camponoti TaxID=1616106 RepID=A0A917QLP8_9NOCA|nr:hypothetical protein GCM10011591_29950 [Nocardia camponoti]